MPTRYHNRKESYLRDDAYTLALPNAIWRYEIKPVLVLRQSTRPLSTLSTIYGCHRNGSLECTRTFSAHRQRYPILNCDNSNLESFNNRSNSYASIACCKIGALPRKGGPFRDCPYRVYTSDIRTRQRDASTSKIRSFISITRQPIEGLEGFCEILMGSIAGHPEVRSCLDDIRRQNKSLK